MGDAGGVDDGNEHLDLGTFGSALLRCMDRRATTIPGPGTARGYDQDTTAASAVISLIPVGGGGRNTRLLEFEIIIIDDHLMNGGFVITNLT